MCIRDSALTALGFSQVLTFNARDVTLGRDLVSDYTGGVTVGSGHTDDSGSGYTDGSGSGSMYDSGSSGHSNRAHLEIRNVKLTATNASYDLYFVYDDAYTVEAGKVLGVRIHEHGSVYSFTATSLLEGRRTSGVGYGNGGTSKAFYIDASEMTGVSEIAVARVRWEPSSLAVSYTHLTLPTILRV